MIEQEEVKEVAKNARLKISEEEAEKFTGDFREILEKFEKLDQIDTENTEPSFHPTKIQSKTRKDEEEDTISKSEAFKNTSNNEDNYFKGPST